MGSPQPQQHPSIEVLASFGSDEHLAYIRWRLSKNIRFRHRVEEFARLPADDLREVARRRLKVRP
jgi:hypothetical protein